MELDTAQPVSADSLPFARNYRQNTIVFLETGSGKTLIAIMLMRSYAYLLRKPSPFIAVFLVPKVALVSQQAAALKRHTDLNVGMYWGEMGVDFWDAATWKKEMNIYENLMPDRPRRVLAKIYTGVQTFFDISVIGLAFHFGSLRMQEFYHGQLQTGKSDLPRIFGMTASPIKSKGNQDLIIFDLITTRKLSNSDGKIRSYSVTIGILATE